MNSKQKVLLLLSIIVLAILAVLYYTGFGKTKMEGELLDTTVKTTTTEIDQSELPKGLPSDLPLEEGIVMSNVELQNSFYDSSSNQVSETQSIRRYVSQKTISQNQTIFEKYLTDNDWQIVYILDEENLKMFLAKKADFEGLLKIQITENTITGDVSVEISNTK